jgi:hypothetical protein
MGIMIMVVMVSGHEFSPYFKVLSDTDFRRLSRILGLLRVFTIVEPFSRPIFVHRGDRRAQRKTTSRLATPEKVK